MRRAFAAAVLLLFSLAPAHADELRVLFVGNSLTYFNEMPWMTEQVANSLDVRPKLVAHFSGASGMSLRQQWDRGKAVRAIREGKYAYVVLQPQSSEIVRRPEETFRYAKLLHDEIRRSGAKTILFLTWAPRTVDTPQFAYNDQTRKLARQLGATVAPVGVAWESLRGKGVELFDRGGLHPNLAGSYLAACVFAAIFYNRPPTGATHTFDVNFSIREFYRESLENERLGAATAAQIQREAWRAVSAERLPRD